MKDTETLLETADRERHNDVWWQEVYDILKDVTDRAAALPEVTEPVVRYSGHTCENCGLPQDAVNVAGITMRLPVRAENSFQQDGRTKAWFHSFECAIQSLYLTLDCKSTAQSVTRSLDGEKVSLADFRSWATAQIRYETIPIGIENKGLRTALFDLMTWQGQEADSLRKSSVESAPTKGRPAKFSSAAERQRAYRKRQAALREATDVVATT